MARMAEWSKAADSSSALVRGVGSNPTPRIFFTRHTNDDEFARLLDVENFLASEVQIFTSTELE